MSKLQVTLEKQTVSACDWCRKSCLPDRPLIELYHRHRDGNSLIRVHESCLLKAIAKAKAVQS